MAENVMLKSPTRVELTITEKCNHRCVHCYNAWRNSSSGRGGMTDEAFERIMEQLVKNGVIYATITGGEPLTDPNLMFRFLDAFRENGIGAGINTNLTLMTEEIADRLVSEYEWENSVLTSLPGFTPQECDAVTQTSGSYERICRGIDVCVSRGIPVAVNAVVTHSNAGRLAEMTPFLEESRISTLALTKVVPPAYGADDDRFSLDRNDLNMMVSFMKEVKERYGISVTSLCSAPLCALDDPCDAELFSSKCAAGIIACSVNGITGSVSPCAHNEQSYGNVFEEELSDIWERMSEWRSGRRMREECAGCAALPACGGECRLACERLGSRMKYDLDGSFRLPDRKAESSKAFDLEAAYSFNSCAVLRKEEFGGIASLGVNELYATKPAFRLLSALKEKGTFGKEYLSEICEINDATLKILGTWEKAGILFKR